MKFYVDKKRTEREFQLGDEVYLKLQPYKQTSVALKKNLKLSSRFYGPYPVIEKIGAVAYKLQLPSNSKIHPVFHVSLLKKKIGAKIVPSIALLEVGQDGQPLVYPATVLDKRIVKRNNQAVTQLLVVWSNLGPENATWEDYTVLQSQFPSFDPWGQGSATGGGIVMNLEENSTDKTLFMTKEESKVGNELMVEPGADIKLVKKLTKELEANEELTKELEADEEQLLAEYRVVELGAKRKIMPKKE